MSETEKKRRADYRKRRRFALILITVLLAAVTIVTACFSVALYHLNKTLYIDYSEEGSVDYAVHVKPNDFYETDVLPAGQAYIASLIDGVDARFCYTLQTEVENISYRYSYWLDTQLLVIDKNTDSAIYSPTFSVKDKQTRTQSKGSKLTVAETAAIDYAYYNGLAERFVKTYGLTNVESKLVARMHVSVLSLCDEFREDTQSEYVITLTVPLSTQTVNVEMSSTVPGTQNKILACENDFDRDMFLAAVIHGSITAAGLLVLLLAVTVLTRNKDITYSIKVKRLLSAYRSFIQQIENPFEAEGYQILHVSTFREMLEIRDTINAPVLMYENEDKTCTQFVIPTSTQLLYLYELKVANYDELYAASATEPEGPVLAEEAPANTEEATANTEEALTNTEEAPANTEEAPALAEEVPAPAEEAPQAVAAFAETEMAGGDAEDSANGFSFGPKYDYSFEARLALADEETVEYYRAIVSFARSFGVKVARSWGRERISFGRKLFAVVTFKARRLVVAFAKDPKTAEAKYHATDVSAYKKFEQTPMLMRISSRRKVKFATDILQELFVAAGLTDKKMEITLDAPLTRSKEELLSAGLIRPKS